MVRIKKIKYMNIYSDNRNAFIIHNTKKEFKYGHTHINGNLSTANYIAHLAVYKQLPKDNHLSLYLIDSIIRISDDNTYISAMKVFKENQLKKQNKKRVQP